ncbi:hypothetical protein [Pseudomonas sp. NPDC089569]|uniref:hypothetical protein n=1 Tax=Pseudomonas sp. NPDC089569 TaxID=3390722 RepID=UPI003D070B07
MIIFNLVLLVAGAFLGRQCALHGSRTHGLVVFTCFVAAILLAVVGLKYPVVSDIDLQMWTSTGAGLSVTMGIIVVGHCFSGPGNHSYELRVNGRPIASGCASLVGIFRDMTDPDSETHKISEQSYSEYLAWSESFYSFQSKGAKLTLHKNGNETAQYTHIFA